MNPRIIYVVGINSCLAQTPNSGCAFRIGGHWHTVPTQGVVPRAKERGGMHRPVVFQASEDARDVRSALRPVAQGGWG